MPYFQCPRIKIAGIACAVPEEEVSVDSLASIFGQEAVSKFQALTGIHRFRRTHDRQTASDLGFAAAKHLLAAKAINPAEIGAIIFVSHSTDYLRPATACVLHKRLGLSKECAAFDVNLGCSAYPYGLFQAASLILNSDIDTALLICAETLSKLVAPKDRSTAPLFGDCGTATLLRKSEQEGGLKGIVRTDGSGYRAVIVPAGGFRNRFAPSQTLQWPDGNERSLYDIYMDGASVFHFTITQVPELLNDFLAKCDVSLNQYDCLALHQANLLILKQIARKLNVSMEKVPISLDRYGNTSSASIPLTLCDAYSSCLSRDRIRVLMCGFGVGLSLGVASVEVSTDDLLPVITTAECFDEGLINSSSDLQAITA
jgi:3-oxoacyl-[acyl-carrier-protein] synthase-3